MTLLSDLHGGLLEHFESGAGTRLWPMSQALGPLRHNGTADTLGLLGIAGENLRCPNQFGARFGRGLDLLDGKCPRNRIGPLVD